MDSRQPQHDRSEASLKDLASAQKPYEEQLIEFLRDRFSFHSPTPSQAQRYQVLRDDFTALAIRIAKLTPQGEYREKAIEQLHIAMMLTNRAIALEG
jgi:hypothetical protein